MTKKRRPKPKHRRYEDIPDPTLSPEEIVALGALVRESLEDHVYPLLRGRHPAEQGAILAELLSLWLAGHPEEMREDLLTGHVEMVRKLTVANAHILRGEK
jgi:hypothetical protein